MTRIIYFDWFSQATEWYRTLPLDYITHPDFSITRSTERDIKAHLLNLYDVIIIERPSTDASLNLIKLAKDMGKRVIIDYDDNCLHLPNDIHPMYNTYQADKPNVIRCLALADEVWVATDGIKKAYRLYNKNIHVIPNAWNDTVFPVEQKKPFIYNKIAMWRGGFSHLGDIYAPGVAEGLVELINTNPLWSFFFLGQRFEWMEMRIIGTNYYRHDGASTVQFYKLMQDYNPCLFLYPLTTNLFNVSKSACSWLESVYSGAAYFGNTSLPEMQKPGMMDLNELPDLLKCKDKTIERTLRSNHTKSWKFIQEHLLLSKVNQKRIERLEKFIK